jgi:aspartate-semialdehyde dehydrogenase
MTDGLRVAVVGATGAVGRVMLETLAARDFPAREIVPFASERSAGRTLDNGAVVAGLADDTIENFDLAIFSAGGGVSGEWAPRFAAKGAVVVDNSSRWRTDPEVPLVVAEVNPEALDGHRGIVANPNCSTMQLMVALKPIHETAGIERLVVSTYQSVSGTGVKAVEELRAQERAILAGDEPSSPEVYPYVIADNVIGAAGNFAEGDDYTDEERKMMFETRKILGDESIGISVTCARVPVPFAHSESVNVQTRERLSAADCRALLASAPGLVVVDDPSRHLHPTARDAAGSDEVFVGRIRQDDSHPRALNLWVVSDNLRKGAATNAVQLAELLHARRLIGASV